VFVVAGWKAFERKPKTISSKGETKIEIKNI
jgi:hypothetical protein